MGAKFLTVKEGIYITKRRLERILRYWIGIGRLNVNLCLHTHIDIEIDLAVCIYIHLFPSSVHEKD